MRPITYILVAAAMVNLVAVAASAETGKARARANGEQPLVTRTQSMVLTRMPSLPRGVIPGTLGSTLFGYKQQDTVAGSLERQFQANQLGQLRSYNGKMYYGSQELNGSLPLLDQVNWVRWSQMNYVPQVMGPMSVVNRNTAATPQVYSSRTLVLEGVPLSTHGTNVAEFHGMRPQPTGMAQSNQRNRSRVARQGKSSTPALDNSM